MHASGAEMSLPYDVDFEHVFPDLPAAERFVQAVARIGRKTELREYNGARGYYWQVRVVVRLVLTHASVTQVEQELETIAASCGGRSDGWGVLHGPA